MAFAFPASLVTPLVTTLFCIFLVVATLSTSLGGYGASNVFAYHGVFMSVAFVGLLPLGALAYRADFGRRGNEFYPDSLSRRVLHGTINTLALFFVLTGFAVAFVYHQTSDGDRHLPWNNPQYSDGKHSTAARSTHVVLGYITVAALVLQGVAGLHKFVQLTKGANDKLAIHGRTGPVIWVFGLVCITVAAYFRWQEKEFLPPGTSSWSVGTAVAIWLGLAAVLGLVMAHFHMASKAHVMKPLGGEDDDAEDDSRFLQRRNSASSKRLLVQ